MKVCLFSSYSKASTIDNYVIFYLEELIRFHDEVVFITNERDVCITPLEGLGVKVVFVKNEGFDFGMWSKVMATMNSDKVDRLTLVNDSCILVKGLGDFFNWEKNNGFDYSGMTNSVDHSYHIQSYFLVVKHQAVKAVFDFFKTRTYSSKEIDEIVMDYEIGLSKHLILNKFKIGALYDFHKYHTPKKTNISIYAAKELLDDGCPLIKKKVAINSFRSDERWVIKNSGYDFSFDYKKYIQEECGLSKKVVKKLFDITKVDESISKLAIWQIYYNDEGLKVLDKKFLPYDNRGKTTMFFENEVISDVHKNQKDIWIDSEYVGVVSWRFSDKTQLFGEDIQTFIDKQKIKKDVYSMLPPSTKGFPSPFSEKGFGHIYKICNIIDEHNLFPFKVSRFSSEGKCKVFCNYFLCKPEIFDDYVNNYLNKLLIWFQTCQDEKLLYYMRLMISHRGKMNPVHPFIAEGLFECYIDYKGYSYGYIENKASSGRNVNNLLKNKFTFNSNWFKK